MRVCGCVFGGLGFRVAGRDTALSRACVSLCVYVCACDVTHLGWSSLCVYIHAISILSIYLSATGLWGNATQIEPNLPPRADLEARVGCHSICVYIYRERVCVCEEFIRLCIYIQ